MTLEGTVAEYWSHKQNRKLDASQILMRTLFQRKMSDSKNDNNSSTIIIIIIIIIIYRG